MQSLDDLFALSNEIKRYEKELSMVYQWSDKQSCANWYYLPIDTFYHLPYDEWVAVRTHWDMAINDIFNNFIEIAIFHGTTKKDLSRFPFNDLRHLYYTWADHTNHPYYWPKEYQK